MHKIKVLQVIGGLNRGGAETFLVNVMRNIDKQKFELSFLCYGQEKYDYEDEIMYLGGKILRIGEPSKVGYINHYKELKKIIAFGEYDIVHSHTYYNSVFSIMASFASKIKCRIAHSHNTKSECNPSIKKRIYFFISKLLINTISTEFFACGLYAGKSFFYRKFKIINNGIEIEKFNFDKNARKIIRNEFNIQDSTFTIGHVGRFEEVKNHNFLIEIFKEYIKLNENSKLILVGDGILRKKIENKIKESKLQDKILILGKRPDVNVLYNSMDFLVFPSFFEGLPVTLVEAQVNGLKILASDTVSKESGITELVEFYSLKNSAEDWAKHIHQINKERLNRYSYFISSNYNIEKGVKLIEKEYLNMYRKHKGENR